ncbi:MULTISPECIES: multidrug transporter [Microbacterium]|uniref:Multidrug transporter n=1 Tax=Microbacterium commune TaxID=2762219 RepID=A0ABR8W353_9MICO|nr:MULTISPECIES: multidrug transporter [Microbacterium]MBD8011454.1 multidrug transporter [Microbacterium commune]OIU84624.1 multidrug transporter [Microbacterium sp. AR7-10]
MSDNTREPEDMTREQKLRDQFLRAEHSTEADAAPRIEVTEHDGNVRIDVADTAAVRPGPGPGVEGADGEGRDDPAR